MTRTKGLHVYIKAKDWTTGSTVHIALEKVDVVEENPDDPIYLDLWISGKVLTIGVQGQQRDWILNKFRVLHEGTVHDSLTVDTGPDD